MYRLIGHFSVTLPAGGWVSVGGDSHNPTVEVKWADGANYDEAVIDYEADAPVNAQFPM